jgi:hypothetical protein
LYTGVNCQLYNLNSKTCFCNSINFCVYIPLATETANVFCAHAPRRELNSYTLSSAGAGVVPCGDIVVPLEGYRKAL